MVCSTQYLNVQAFFPLFVKLNYKDAIDATRISLALGAFNLAGVIFTPIHGISISKMGHKNSILLGMMFVLISNIVLGMLSLIPDYDVNLFILISVIARFV